MAAGGQTTQAEADRPIGKELLDQIMEAGSELRRYIREDFADGEDVYRVTDFAEYVSAKDWEQVWSKYPPFWEEAWQLADNGQYSSDEVARMSIAEIDAAFNDPAFYPEYTYFTEWEDDMQYLEDYEPTR